MKVNEVLTEGPVDSVLNALDSRKRNKQAKALAKQRKKQLPKLVKQAQTILATVADKAIVQAKAAGKDIDPEDLADVFETVLERILKVDIKPGTEVGDAVDDIIDQVVANPETVKRDPKIKSLLGNAMASAMEIPSMKSGTSLSSSPGILVQDGPRHFVKYKGNTKWVEYAKDGDEYSFVGEITTKVMHDQLNQLAQSGRTPIKATATPAADDRNVTIQRLPDL